MTSAPAAERAADVPRSRAVLAGAVQAVRRAFVAVGDTWRRSLQLRVGATTVVVAGIVTLVIGVFLVDKVAGGVLRAKRDAAIDQAKIGISVATEVLRNKDLSVAQDRASAEQQITQRLTGSTAGTFRIALLQGASAGDDPELADAIPRGLRRVVRQSNLAVQYAPVPVPGGRSDQARSMVAGLIVGEPIQAGSGQVELYYLFPLTAEQQTISLVQRTVLLAGFALVVLVLAIALLVTRQVVRPVRVAAESASRLAAGDLSQRIAVRGQDDLARLGQSFNEMADSLQRQSRRLEELSRLQRRFTSDVSHGLRTPLTTLRMAAEYLHGSRSGCPPAPPRAAELLHAELDRFEGLLADLLEIPRYDAGAAQLESEPVDIRGVIASTVAANRMLAERHGSELVVNVPDTAVSVDMDSRRVERILRNLVGNALEHGEGKPVIITVGWDANAVAITVRDHGLGLKPGQASLVFNRFWRGDASRSRLTGGTGLGLAISLEDARLHDGWLQAWGEVGRGAQFRLTLPRRAGHTLMHSPLPLDPDEVDEEDE